VVVSHSAFGIARRRVPWCEAEILPESHCAVAPYQSARRYFTTKVVVRYRKGQLRRVASVALILHRKIFFPRCESAGANTPAKSRWTWMPFTDVAAAVQWAQTHCTLCLPTQSAKARSPTDAKIRSAVASGAPQSVVLALAAQYARRHGIAKAAALGARETAPLLASPFLTRRPLSPSGLSRRCPHSFDVIIIRPD
jgi:hypothetical protein